MTMIQAIDVTHCLGSVLVIGGYGFLGHRIARTLLETHASNNISVLDLRTDRNRLRSISYYKGDICSRSDIQSTFARVKAQVIFHTASPPAPFDSLDLFMRVNILGTRNLLECAQEGQTVVAFVYTSSATVVHDEVNDRFDIDDNAPVLYMPVRKDTYDHSKAVTDSLILNANCQDSKMLTTAIHPSGMFGEDDLITVKPMVNAAAEVKYKYQVGNGRNLFDWTYVGNVAHAHVLAAQVLPRAFNSGVWITSFGRRKSSMTRRGIQFSTMTRTCRIDKAKRQSGYKPLVSMKEGRRIK